MDNYTKAVSTVIALSVLALPVKAEEKVWYCEMTGLAKTTLEGAETFKTQKFKMKVSETSVAFGTGGFFSDITVPIVSWIGADKWHAADGASNIRFEDGAFHCAMSSFSQTIAMSARCDDF